MTILLAPVISTAAMITMPKMMPTILVVAVTVFSPVSQDQTRAGAGWLQNLQFMYGAVGVLVLLSNPSGWRGPEP
jgi:hypothetical protein